MSASLALCPWPVQNPDRDFLIKFSALEIYNEVVKDLLHIESGPLRLLDDPEVSKQSAHC